VTKVESHNNRGLQFSAGATSSVDIILCQGAWVVGVHYLE
jgi:hypothetical protein